MSRSLGLATIGVPLRRGAARDADPVQPTAPLPDLWQIGDSTHYEDTARTTLAADDGDLLASLTDSATTGPYHASQATAGDRPTLALNVAKGHAGIRFSAAQEIAQASVPLTNGTGRTKGTVIAVFKSEELSPPGGAVFSTTQDQLGLLSDGRFALNTAAAEYGSMNGSAHAAARGGSVQIFTGIYDGSQAGNSTRLRLWRNAGAPGDGGTGEETLTYTGTIPANFYAGGQTLYQGREAGGSGWAHVLLELLVFRDVALTDGERQAWEAWLGFKYATKTTKQLVVQGDSNAKGSPNHVDSGWPQRVTTALGWATVANNSTVGFKLSAAAANPTISGRDDWHQAQPFVIALGTNDLAVDHASLATLQGDFNTMKGKLANARYPIFACTIPASGANIAGADETTRTDFNTWLTGVAGITVIDIATALGDPTGAGSANFEGDDLHLSDAGHNVVSAAVQAAFVAAGY